MLVRQVERAGVSTFSSLKMKVDWQKSPEIASPERRHGSYYTDKKENQIFLVYKEIQNGAVAKSYMTNDLLGNNCAFPHILGSPS